MKRLVLLTLSACLALLGPAAMAQAEVSMQVTTLEPAGFVEDVAVGDVNGDGSPDMVTAYGSIGIGVQLNDGHGHFGATHLYATGCESTNQVELADVGAPPSSIFPDGHLDAVIACSNGSGDSIELGRMFGDGSGGFSAPVMFPESGYGTFNGLGQLHQGFGLFEFRGPAGPPVSAWTFAEPSGHFLCWSFDWSTRQCATSPEAGYPLVAGQVAEAELFTTGGTEGLLDWGFKPEVRASTRDFGPMPFEVTGGDTWQSIATGDLQGNGPDIFTSAGTSGAVPEEPATGRVSVLYGDSNGVPVQPATTFPSALGVESINTGDFDLDGHTDVVGTDYHYSAATGSISGVFFQAGDGAGGLGAPQEINLSTSERFDIDPVRVADLDGNGTPDVVAIVGGKVQVLLNQKVRPPATVTPISAPAVGNPLVGIKKLPKKTKLLPNGTILLGTATNPPTAAVTITITVPGSSSGKGGKGKVHPRPFLATASSKKKTKKKPTVIGKAHIAVPAGKTVPLKVKLTPKARHMVEKHPLHAKVNLIATSTTGTKLSETKSLTIEPAKKKKGKRGSK